MPRLECRIAKFCLVKRLLSISAVQAAAWASAVTPAWPVQRCSSVTFVGCCAPLAVDASAAATTASTNGFRLPSICGFYRCDGHQYLFSHPSDSEVIGATNSFPLPLRERVTE